jgi:hypothetical protein
MGLSPAFSSKHLAQALCALSVSFVCLMALSTPGLHAQAPTVQGGTGVGSAGEGGVTGAAGVGADQKGGVSGAAGVGAPSAVGVVGAEGVGNQSTRVQTGRGTDAADVGSVKGADTKGTSTIRATVKPGGGASVRTPGGVVTTGPDGESNTNEVVSSGPSTASSGSSTGGQGLIVDESEGNFLTRNWYLIPAAIAAAALIFLGVKRLS